MALTFMFLLKTLLRLLLPICSRNRLISGWNRTTRASIPSSNALLNR